MAKGNRDFKREYARRKRNALARGFTTAQARGHARPKIGEAPISKLRDAAKERTQATATSSHQGATTHRCGRAEVESA